MYVSTTITYASTLRPPGTRSCRCYEILPKFSEMAPRLRPSIIHGNECFKDISKLQNPITNIMNPIEFRWVSTVYDRHNKVSLGSYSYRVTSKANVVPAAHLLTSSIVYLLSFLCLFQFCKGHKFTATCRHRALSKHTLIRSSVAIEDARASRRSVAPDVPWRGHCRDTAQSAGGTPC